MKALLENLLAAATTFLRNCLNSQNVVQKLNHTKWHLFDVFNVKFETFSTLKDRFQISSLILIEFKRINYYLLNYLTTIPPEIIKKS